MQQDAIPVEPCAPRPCRRLHCTSRAQRQRMNADTARSAAIGRALGSVRTRLARTYRMLAQLG